MPNPPPKSAAVAQVTKQLESLIISGIMDYVKNDVFPNNSSDCYMNAYTIVQTKVDSGIDEALFNYHNEVIKEVIEHCYKKVKDKKNLELIDIFIKQTEKINFLIYWMNRIFTYLDRFYTNSHNKRSLSKNAIDLYNNYFFLPMQTEIHKEVNKLIKEDRCCITEQRPKIKIIMKIISDLDLANPKIIKEHNSIYWIEDTTPIKNKKVKKKKKTEHGDKWFKETFERETTKFIKDKAAKDATSMSASEYIAAQLKYLDEEEIRKKEYINPDYHEEIDKINYYYLVGEHAKDIAKMDTGIKYMFENRRNEELASAYKLFKLFPETLMEITRYFQPYIKKRGAQISENKEISKNPKKFIPELINLKNEMDNLVHNCFENNQNFEDTKNKAFSSFMNTELYSKQLSNYTDFCMKIGFKGKSEEEVEKILNDIIDLFRCLNLKLTYQLDQNAKMSDRLIKNTSISTNYEKKLISKLKQEQGVTYVNKMTQMIVDLDKNKTETEMYKSRGNRGMPGGIKFNVQVVSQSAWEINKKAMEIIEIPKFLKNCINDFENFYYHCHRGQKLTWCLGMSKLELQYICFKNKNISTSTLPQVLILLQLEKYEKLSLLKLAEMLGCPVSTILNDVPGLIYNPSFNPQGLKDKGLVLGTFDDQTKEFKETDEIWFNKGFTLIKQKFQTLPLPLKKSASQVKETELEEARITKKYQDNILQATITRIMKSRIGQRTTHVWLLGEAAKQVDLFRAQPEQIKENMEKLIEKHIMKRSVKDRTCYEYIA